ncbi:MAG TPA: phosphatase PAP2 family protein [Frankiaceae bacterium]|nr:phosphatase PAP2 family protein [Frankiaceae bacterium]
MHPRLDPESRYGLRLTLFAAALLLVAVPFGILLDQVVRNGPLLAVDQGVAERFHGVVARNAPVRVAARAVTLVGSPPTLYVVAGLAIVYVLRHGRRRLALYLAVTGVLGGVIDTVVKVLVDRPRPVFDEPIAHAFGKSFPSGHSMSSTVVYGAVLLAFLPALRRRGVARPAVAGTVAIVVLVALSRLALGVHYLSDVVGGVTLGAAWLCASTGAFRIWRTERGAAPAPVGEGAEPEAARLLS